VTDQTPSYVVTHQTPSDSESWHLGVIVKELNTVWLI